MLIRQMAAGIKRGLWLINEIQFNHERQPNGQLDTLHLRRGGEDRGGDGRGREEMGREGRIEEEMIEEGRIHPIPPSIHFRLFSLF